MRPTWILFSTLLSAPATILAHGDSHAPDPDLHVDPRVKDCEVRFAPELTQEAFHRFVREFGSVAAFKQMGPPTTLGRRGLSAGLEYMAFTVDDKSDAWNDTFVHPDSTHELGSDLAFPKLKLQFGITDHTDVSLFFTKNTSSNYGWLGLDMRHALLRQGPGMPVTLAVRGAYTKTLFVSDMDMHALTGGVSAGRVLWSRVTPYLGVGVDWIVARETASSVDLDPEWVSVGHALAGLQVAFWHVALGAEAQMGTINSAQVQLAAWY